MEKWENTSLSNTSIYDIHNPRYGFFYDKKAGIRNNSMIDADAISQFNPALIDHKNENVNIEYSPIDVFMNAKRVCGSVSKTPVVSNKNKKNTLSGYQLYSREMRPIIAHRNPSVSFGEITKTLGQMWSALSSTDQDDYCQRAKNMPDTDETQNEINSNELYFNIGQSHHHGDDGSGSMYGLSLGNQFPN